jgi:hypothetical protein
MGSLAESAAAASRLPLKDRMKYAPAFGRAPMQQDDATALRRSASAPSSCRTIASLFALSPPGPPDLPDDPVWLIDQLERMMKLTKTQIAMKIFTVAVGVIAGVIVIAAIGYALQQWGLMLLMFSLKVSAAMALMGAVGGVIQYGIDAVRGKMLAKAVDIEWNDVR